MSEINDITPEQAVKLFETGRGVILDEILRKVPDFDIHHADEEHFRALVLLGVKVAKLTAPVRVESVLEIIDQFASLIVEVARNQKGESHAHFH